MDLEKLRDKPGDLHQNEHTVLVLTAFELFTEMDNEYSKEFFEIVESVVVED